MDTTVGGPSLRDNVTLPIEFFFAKQLSLGLPPQQFAIRQRALRQRVPNHHKG